MENKCKRYSKSRNPVISVMLKDGTLVELPPPGSKQELVIHEDGTAEIININNTKIINKKDYGV